MCGLAAKWATLYMISEPAGSDIQFGRINKVSSNLVYQAENLMCMNETLTAAPYENALIITFYMYPASAQCLRHKGVT